jgi:hypothetical protein
MLSSRFYPPPLLANHGFPTPAIDLIVLYTPPLEISFPGWTISIASSAFPPGESGQCITTPGEIAKGGTMRERQLQAHSPLGPV